MQYLLVRGYCYRLRRIDDPIDVPGRHLLVADRHDAVRVEAAHVAAGNSRVNGVDVTSGHQFGFLDSALDRVHCGFNIYDDTLLQTARWMRADPDDLDLAVVVHLADDRDDFRCADIETDDQVLVTALLHDYGAPLDASMAGSSSCGSFTGVSAPSFQPIVKPLL